MNTGPCPLQSGSNAVSHVSKASQGPAIVCATSLHKAVPVILAQRHRCGDRPPAGRLASNIGNDHFVSRIKPHRQPLQVLLRIFGKLRRYLGSHPATPAAKGQRPQVFSETPPRFLIAAFRIRPRFC